MKKTPLDNCATGTKLNNGSEASRYRDIWRRRKLPQAALTSYRVNSNLKAWYTKLSNRNAGAHEFPGLKVTAMYRDRAGSHW